MGLFIKRAAIFYENGGIVEGKSYGQISSLARKIGFSGDRIYGYIDSSDEFLVEDAGIELARNAGQAGKECEYPEDIFGEGETEDVPD